MNRATIIVHCDIPQFNGEQFLKYHNIDLLPGNIPNKAFLIFAARFPGVTHLNLYNPKLPKKQNFIRQIKFDRCNGAFKTD